MHVDEVNRMPINESSPIDESIARLLSELSFHRAMYTLGEESRIRQRDRHSVVTSYSHAAMGRCQFSIVAHTDVDGSGRKEQSMTTDLSKVGPLGAITGKADPPRYPPGAHIYAWYEEVLYKVYFDEPSRKDRVEILFTNKEAAETVAKRLTHAIQVCE